MKKTLIAALLCFALLSGQAFAFTFEKLEPSDVFSPEIIEQERVSEWAENEIELARQAGLITEHTSDYMTRSITRFQFAELIVNLAEKVTGKEIVPAADSTFTDCTETVVLKAYAAGIVSGIGDNRFAPDTTTNREQIAAMIYRAVAYINAQATKPLALEKADVSKFTDQAQVSSWALEGMGTLAANGIMAGTSATTLSPKNACTVEQSILLVYRLYQKAS
ncbi:conserved exported hypothetical protein [uncultured Eubacteriales bacterium]|uniref:SLH domain-containing protein n=1 Tax=uncultured Eubacteriales bacterium TaxID=172733 RepID=A0A212KER3_9FIRM|nr:conserved exported hypothetical protein [uncultured Eubacteriales bacterium]